MNKNQYIEFEHKFVVESDFDIEAFSDNLNSLSPEKSYQVKVLDTYYLPSNKPEFIVRHRKDRLLNQLTYKQVGVDSEKRVEINLDLDRDADSKTAEQFLCQLMPFKKITIEKDVHVFYFNEVEVVYYVATSNSKKIHCVEFEVRQYTDDNSAKKILENFENKLGFTNMERETKSLLELLSRD